MDCEESQQQSKREFLVFDVWIKRMKIWNEILGPWLKPMKNLKGLLGQRIVPMKIQMDILEMKIAHDNLKGLLELWIKPNKK